MSPKAQAILDEIRALPPEDLQAVGSEVSQLLARATGGAGGGEAGAAPGRVLRAEPPGGHPSGSLEPDDPFFRALEEIRERGRLAAPHRDTTLP